MNCQKDHYNEISSRLLDLYDTRIQPRGRYHMATAGSPFDICVGATMVSSSGPRVLAAT